LSKRCYGQKAYHQLTAKPQYARGHQTIAFIEREMIGEENGFFNALDAIAKGLKVNFIP
jgi:uncharacterized protein YyaL (SSP411 family)